MLFLAGLAGVIDINGTVIVELITFLIMLGILARYVYPELVKRAEARQRAITEQLREAEKARAEAEEFLKSAEAQVNEARKTARDLIESATKSADQLRQEMRQKAEDDAKRTVVAAHKEIEAERDRAVRAVRNEVAGLVVAATERVIGQTLDESKHKQLIERAIAEVASGDGGR